MQLTTDEISLLKNEPLAWIEFPTRARFQTLKFNVCHPQLRLKFFNLAFHEAEHSLVVRAPCRSWRSWTSRGRRRSRRGALIPVRTNIFRDFTRSISVRLSRVKYIRQRQHHFQQKTRHSRITESAYSLVSSRFITKDRKEDPYYNTTWQNPTVCGLSWRLTLQASSQRCQSAFQLTEPPCP